MKQLNADFIISAEKLSQCPDFPFPEFPLLGRSNVGKSSFINALCNNKKLAKTSNTPGKTRLINFFNFSDKFMVADLPGYGYAKVSKDERDRWGRLMESYFAEEGLITLGVLIVDARHKPTADDVTMCDYFKSTLCPMVVVANKLDKLKKSEIEPNLALIRQTLTLDDHLQLIPFSAEKGTGKTELLAAISQHCGK